MKAYVSVLQSVISTGQYMQAEMEAKISILYAKGQLDEAEYTSLMEAAAKNADPEYTGKTEEIARIETLERATLDLIDLVMSIVPDDVNIA